MTLARPVEHDLAAEALAAKPISHWKLACWRLSRDKVTLVAGSVLVLIILRSRIGSDYQPVRSQCSACERERSRPHGIHRLIRASTRNR